MANQETWEQYIEQLMDQPLVFKVVPAVLAFMFLLVPLIIYLSTSNLSIEFAALRKYLDSWIRALHFLVAGPAIIDRAYAQSHSNPFTVVTPFNKLVLVSSEKHVQELAAAPGDELSLHSLAKDALQPKYTMHGFEWAEKRGVEGTGFVRALRSLLTANLPTLLPEIHTIMQSTIDQQVSSGASTSGASTIPLLDMVKQVVVAVNCVTFFGKDMSNKRDFTDAALSFPQDAFVVGELLNLFPDFLKPSVAYMATKGHRAAKTLVSYLRPLVEQRLKLKAAEEESDKPPTSKPIDCMQWLIDTAPRKNPWTVERMMGEIMGVWFGSVHQLAMTTTYALEQLCHHPEYIGPLRDEISKAFSSDNKYKDIDKLPLLNSFVMETARFETTEAITCRRKALVPFTYFDGTRVEVGDWTCLPQKAIIQDAENYPNPTEFDGFRFAKKEDVNGHAAISKAGQETSSRMLPKQLTDVNALWPIWGIGKPACPGRFYASIVQKLILAHVLQTYEMELENPKAKMTMSWRTTIVPRSSVKIRLRPRNQPDASKHKK